jgi:hypothetical protein
MEYITCILNRKDFLSSIGEMKMTLTMLAEMPRKKRIKSDFGERLIELRKARGMTQYHLADAIGTT